jgi:CRP-like cAMP-binding protein
VTAGTQLWQQGEVPPELVFVKSGLLASSATDSAGQELGASVRGPRSLLGFESLRGQPARAAVEALADTVVCTATPTTLRQHTGLQGSGYGDAAELAANASAMLQLTLDELCRIERDGDLRSGSAISRVARFISSYGDLIASGQQAPFSKRHVATLLGLRAETLSRCLRQLKTTGVIGEGPGIQVLDAPKLEQLSRGELTH